MKKDIFAKRKINRRILRAFFNVVQAVSLAVFIVMGTVYLVGIGQYGFGQSSIKSEIKSRVNSMTKIAGRYAALMQNKEALKTSSDRKSTGLNSSHTDISRMPTSA